MKKLKTNIEIEVKNIKVDDGYYSFDYFCSINGKRARKFSYDSDFDSQSAEQFKKILEAGYALEIALQQMSENF